MVLKSEDGVGEFPDMGIGFNVSLSLEAKQVSCF